MALDPRTKGNSLKNVKENLEKMEKDLVNDLVAASEFYIPREKRPSREMIEQVLKIIKSANRTVVPNKPDDFIVSYMEGMSDFVLPEGYSLPNDKEGRVEEMRGVYACLIEYYSRTGMFKS